MLFSWNFFLFNLNHFVIFIILSFCLYSFEVFDFFRVRHKEDVLVLLGKVDEVQVALKLGSLLTFDDSLHPNKSQIVIFFKFPPLLSLCTCVLTENDMLSVFYGSVSHLVIELIRVSGSRFLA